MPNTTQRIYLGRQPIVDSDQRIQGFELLFRSGRDNSAAVGGDPGSNRAATSAVITRALSTLGMETVLGNHPGFINCDADFLMSDAIDLLPPDRIVLEILETSKYSEGLRQRCMELKARGFKLALDDFRGDDSGYLPLLPLLPLMDIVKVDVLGLSESELERTTDQLSPFAATLVAEKVETGEQFARCAALGYRLFQGYYFSRPQIIAGKRIAAPQAALLHLISLIQREAGGSELELQFKMHPPLAVKLLRLANSVSSKAPVQMQSIADAIGMLGYRRLREWLLMLLEDSLDARGSSPLLRLAACRGRDMERLALDGKAPGVRPDSAFIAGVVSVMDRLLGMPMPALLASLGLAGDIGAALLERQGALGELLTQAESVEAADSAADYAIDDDAAAEIAIDGVAGGIPVNGAVRPGMVPLAGRS